jgi:tetratricopeptide (TPR) repeat protein
MMTGDYENGLRVAEERADLIEHLNTPIYFHFARLYESHAQFFAGLFEEARSSYIELMAAFSQPNQLPVRLLCRSRLAVIDLHSGDYAAVLKNAAFLGDSLNDFHLTSHAVSRGQVHLLSADWDKADLELKKYHAFVLSHKFYELLGLPLALWGYIAYRRGDRAAALDYLAQALENGVEKGFFVSFMLAFSVLAVMLAEAGRLVQAVELYATVTAHPFARNSQWFEDLFGKPLEGLCVGLPEEAVKTAQERGQGKALREVGENYLRMIRESQWSF